MALVVSTAVSLTLIILAGHQVNSVRNGAPTPVVLLHGIGDTCCDPGTIGGFKIFLEENIPGVYVRSIRIGNNLIEDKLNSYFMPAHSQVAEVCRQIQQDPNLKSGYHAVGFSQGGLLMRAATQTCSVPPVLNLVTFGGPQQGVYGYPQCDVTKHFCDLLRRFISTFVYQYLVQIVYIPLQYWHDPLDEERYSTESIFLADVNNAKEVKKEYRDNLIKLQKFVMILFKRDQVVMPSHSAWFEFYGPGQSKEILSLNESELYKSDLLGLRQLDTEGKLVFLEIDAPHMIFDYAWVKANVLKYLL